jgi:hypothetical protein
MTASLPTPQVPKVQSYEAAGWVFVAFATVEGMVGDEPASATYPLNRRTAGTINIAGARVFLYREPAGQGVSVFVTNTAGDQVLDLVPEWDYVDGGHLLAPADDFAAGWFAVAYAVEVGAGQGSLDAMVAGPLAAVRVNVADIRLLPVSVRVSCS